MQKNMKAHSNLIKLIAVTVLSLGLTMISSFILARLLSVDERGLHQLFITSVSYVVTISTGGLGFALALCMRNKQYEYWRFYFTIFLLFSCLVSLLALLIFDLTSFHLLFIFNVVLTSILTITLEKCKIDPKLKVYRTLTLQQPILLVSIYGICYLLFGEQPLRIVLYLLTLHTSLQAITCILYLSRIEKEYKRNNEFKKIELKFFIKTWYKQNLLQIFGATAVNLDKFLIVFFLGNYTLGLYTVCIAFDSLLTRFINILADYYYSGLLNNVNRLKSVLVIMFLISISVIVLVPFISEPVIMLFFSDKYIEIAPVLIWFIINSIVAGLAWILSQNMLLLGKQLLIFTRQFISIIVFVLLFYLLKEYQLYGLAYAYLGSSFARLVISVIYFYKYPVKNVIEG